MSARILLIDDERAFCELCSLWLNQSGYEVVSCGDAESGLAAFNQAKEDQPFDLIIHDLALPPSFHPQDGLQSIQHYQDVPLLVLTGHDDRSLAVQAIELGAWDFIAKPVDPDMLKIIIARALDKHSLLKQVSNLEQQLQQRQPETPDFGLIGNSASVQATRELIQRISATQVPVFIQGPSGTGKEIIANAIHQGSSRKDKAFISVHCGAIPAELLESELFGYKKGAFTGADKDRKGLLATADGGTLFLDEIGEMPLAMQVKLLRVLQEGSYYPVGSRELEQIDIRLVSATNRDVPSEVQQGNFREDLYYRIKGLTITTTGLEQRKEDITPLVNHFIALYNQQHNTSLSVDNDACRWFLSTPWPGNVRELKNTLESAAAISLNNSISMQEIQLIRGDSSGAVTTSSGQHIEVASDASLEEQVSALEIKLIQQALDTHQGNRTHSAQALGITRQGLINKIKRYGL
ncbi:MAG: sigma-54 dependent transcriptional regulator [Saccharospirillaceae bacterium]|nr:sigma-54 dependent transcriptional regulator [Saccharospirillaceae bacterium]